MHSPLEQFTIKELIPFDLFGMNLAFTNASLFMVLTVLASTVLMLLPMRRPALIPTRWQSLPEMLYEFIQGVVRDVIGPAGMKFLPLVFTLFMELKRRRHGANNFYGSKMNKRSVRRRAPVAQLDRASACGAEGRRFKSCQVYHANAPLLVGLLRGLCGLFGSTTQLRSRR